MRCFFLRSQSDISKRILSNCTFISNTYQISCGDYASGTNHVLPTYGYARMYSGVNTSSFLKHITSQRLTAAGLEAIGDAVMTLAEVEGLEGHRNAVAVRMKDIRNVQSK